MATNPAALHYELLRDFTALGKDLGLKDAELNRFVVEQVKVAQDKANAERDERQRVRDYEQQVRDAELKRLELQSVAEQQARDAQRIVEQQARDAERQYEQQQSKRNASVSAMPKPGA